MRTFHFLTKQGGEEEASTSSSSDDSLEPVTQFKKMESNKLGLTSYRGFSTSISHSFMDEEQEHDDLCSFTFCGLLQKERNRYILTGKKPFRTTHSRFFRIISIVFVLILSVYLMLEHADVVVYFMLAELILGLLFIYGVYLILKSSEKSKKFRREVLWNTFQGDGTGPAPFPEEYQDEEIGEHFIEDFMQGQTHNDLARAHACCACYRNDIIDEEMDVPIPGNMCGCMWRYFSMMCCGEMGHFLQLCGMCAVAQESREIKRMIPAHQRAIDYVTFQNVISYYSQIIVLRQTRNGNIFKHFMATSKLSQFIIYSFLVTCSVAAIICLLFKYPIDYLVFVMISFALAFAMTFIFHWPMDKMHISVDAVIKAFAYGFWVASTTAFFLEGLAGILSEGSVYISHTFFINDDDSQTRYSSVWDGTIGFYAAASYIHLGNGINSEFWMRANEVWYIAYLFFQCFFIAAFIEELLKYLAFRLLSDHPDFWSKTRLDDVIAGTLSTSETTTLNLDLLQKIQRKVQERPLRKRARAIIVAMIAVSLGYAACENLVYLCYYGNGTIDFTFFLLRALLLPIHPICSVWQALGVCRRDLEKKSEFQVGLILLPAILWHGFFDFTVLVGAFVLQKSENYGLAYKLIALLIPVLIIIVALVLLIYKIKALLKDLHMVDKMFFRDELRPWTWAGDELANSFDTEVKTTYTYDSQSGIEIAACGTEIEAQSINDSEPPPIDNIDRHSNHNESVQGFRSGDKTHPFLEDFVPNHHPVLDDSPSVSHSVSPSVSASVSASMSSNRTSPYPFKMTINPFSGTISMTRKNKKTSEKDKLLGLTKENSTETAALASTVVHVMMESFQSPVPVQPKRTKEPASILETVESGESDICSSNSSLSSHGDEAELSGIHRTESKTEQVYSHGLQTVGSKLADTDFQGIQISGSKDREVDCSDLQAHTLKADEVESPLLLVSDSTPADCSSALQSSDSKADEVYSESSCAIRSEGDEVDRLVLSTHSSKDGEVDCSELQVDSLKSDEAESPLLLVSGSLPADCSSALQSSGSKADEVDPFAFPTHSSNDGEVDCSELQVDSLKSDEAESPLLLVSGSLPADCSSGLQSSGSKADEADPLALPTHSSKDGEVDCSELQVDSLKSDEAESPLLLVSGSLPADCSSALQSSGSKADEVDPFAFPTHSSNDGEVDCSELQVDSLKSDEAESPLLLVSGSLPADCSSGLQSSGSKADEADPLALPTHSSKDGEVDCSELQVDSLKSDEAESPLLLVSGSLPADCSSALQSSGSKADEADPLALSTHSSKDGEVDCSELQVDSLKSDEAESPLLLVSGSLPAECSSGLQSRGSKADEVYSESSRSIGSKVDELDPHAAAEMEVPLETSASTLNMIESCVMESKSSPSHTADEGGPGQDLEQRNQRNQDVENVNESFAISCLTLNSTGFDHSAAKVESKYESNSLILEVVADGQENQCAPKAMETNAATVVGDTSSSFSYGSNEVVDRPIKKKVVRFAIEKRKVAPLVVDAWIQSEPERSVKNMWANPHLKTSSKSIPSFMPVVLNHPVVKDSTSGPSASAVTPTSGSLLPFNMKINPFSGAISTMRKDKKKDGGSK